MSTQTDLWLVVGHEEEDGPWEWGFLTVRAPDHMQAARAAAAYTKRVSSVHGDEALNVPLSSFPDMWVVTELLLPEVCPQGIVVEEADEETCANIRDGFSVPLRLRQGASHVVRL